jgi:glycosyltransferase involved in cell wall biosynthesis
MLSIIISCYNVAKTIERTLASIDRQTSDDYEVILVDDGSTDGSLALLQRYAEGKTYVHVAHLPNNQGVSSARNAGMKVAKGEYLYFLDGDDAVEEDMVATFQEKQTDDLILAGYLHEKGRGRWFSHIPSTQTDYLTAYFRGSIYICIGAFAVSRKLIERYGLLFDEHLRYAEDVLFITTCLLNASTIRVISHPVLRYCFTPNSATHSLRYDWNRYSMVSAWKRIWQMTSGRNCQSWALMRWQLATVLFFVWFCRYGDASDTALRSTITKDLNLLKRNSHHYFNRYAAFVQLMRVAYKLNCLWHR